VSSSRLKNYEILDFSDSVLFEALANEWIDSSAVSRLPQPRYLVGYLRHFEVNKIIIETDYVDRDYLEDYASFYVSSFKPYNRFTRRLHFFKTDISAADLEKILLASDPAAEKSLVEAYVGFVVARPLPTAVIGRTVLKTYEEPRLYPVTRMYYPHLFGIKLQVRSLAYQQQDTVVAACATVALWTAFHKTQELFESRRPSPAEITRQANLVRGSGRAIPSRSLTDVQIGEAIRSVGLEPECIDVLPEKPLLSLLYSYCAMGIPVILLVWLRGQGGHAITLTGFRLAETPNTCEPPGRVAYRGRRIQRLFVHDDNIGPFAYADIVPKPDEIVNANEDSAERSFYRGAPFALQLAYRDDADQKQITECAPVAVMVPVSHNIRLTFVGIDGWLEALATVLQAYGSMFGLTYEDLDWDVRLTPSNEFKRELRAITSKPRGTPDVLTTPYPQYIWRVTLRENDRRIFELSADATEVESAFPFLDILYHDASIERGIRHAFSLPAVRDIWSREFGKPLVDFLTRLPGERHMTQQVAAP